MEGTLRLEVEYDGDGDHSKERDREEMADTLHRIAQKVREGFTRGTVGESEWDLTREEV